MDDGRTRAGLEQNKAVASERDGARFLQGLWDRADKNLIPTIFHDNFTFRGSLGPALVGHQGFAGYVDFVTSTFGSYTTDILSMIDAWGHPWSD